MFLMFYETFLSPQVKWGTIFSNKHGTHKRLKIQDLRKFGKVRKISKFNIILSQRPVSPPQKQKPCRQQQKNAGKQKLNPSQLSILHMKTRVCLKYLVNDYLWKQIFASNSAQILSNLISFTIFFNSKAFHTALTLHSRN